MAAGLTTYRTQVTMDGVAGTSDAQSSQLALTMGARSVLHDAGTGRISVVCDIDAASAIDAVMNASSRVRAVVHTIYGWRCTVVDVRGSVKRDLVAGFTSEDEIHVAGSTAVSDQTEAWRVRNG